MRSVGLLYVSLDSVLSSIDLDSFLASIRSKWAGELSSTHPASGSLFPYYSVFLEILLTKLLNNVSIQLFSYWVSFGKMKSISMF